MYRIAKYIHGSILNENVAQPHLRFFRESKNVFERSALFFIFGRGTSFAHIFGQIEIVSKREQTRSNTKSVASSQIKRQEVDVRRSKLSFRILPNLILLP